MGAFDIAQIGQFQAGLDAVGVGEQLGQEPAPRMPGSALECDSEPAGRGQPEPQGVGDERDHIAVAPRRGEVETVSSTVSRGGAPTVCAERTSGSLAQEGPRACAR